MEQGQSPNKPAMTSHLDHKGHDLPKHTRGTRRRAHRHRQAALAAAAHYGDGPNPLYAVCRRCLANPEEPCRDYGRPLHRFHEERETAAHTVEKISSGHACSRPPQERSAVLPVRAAR